MLRLDRLEPLLEARPDALDVLGDAVVEDLGEHAQRRAAREQVAAIGRAVVAEGQRVRDLLADECRTDRDAAAERLADRHQMRLEAERLEIKWVAGAAEAALDLVGDEQGTGFRARRLDRGGKRRR